MENRRTVPYNVDAEIYVLGSAFIDNRLLSGYIGKLTENDFYDERNQAIYRAMINLFNQGKKVEIITVVEELKRLGVNVDEAYRVYLLDLIDAVPSTSTTNLYMQIVEEKSLERKLLKDMQEISDDILSSRLDFNGILDKTEDSIINVIKKRRTSLIMGIDKASDIVYQQIQKFTENNSDLTGLDTGYPNLNKTTLGFQKGDLMILAARPSVGKSTFAINLAIQVSKLNNAHVALFSLEMSIEQLLMRMYSYQAEIELSNIRSGKLSSEDMLLLGLAKQDLSKLHIYFDEDSSSNISDIRTKCRQLKNEGKLDFVIIDYLQLITAVNSRGNRQEEVSMISRSLKTLARELEVPILALSQLSRSIEGRENKIPQLADLRESGSIEQDADLVLFLFRRADVEDENETSSEDNQQQTPRKKNEEVIQEIVLSVAKNRQGPLSYIDYHFYGSYCRFNEQRITKKLLVKKAKKKKNFTE